MTNAMFGRLCTARTLFQTQPVKLDQATQMFLTLTFEKNAKTNVTTETPGASGSTLEAPSVDFRIS